MDKRTCITWKSGKIKHLAFLMIVLWILTLLLAQKSSLKYIKWTQTNGSLAPLKSLLTRHINMQLTESSNLNIAYCGFFSPAYLH